MKLTATCNCSCTLNECDKRKHKDILCLCCPCYVCTGGGCVKSLRFVPRSLLLLVSVVNFDTGFGPSVRGPAESCPSPSVGGTSVTCPSPSVEGPAESGSCQWFSSHWFSVGSHADSCQCSSIGSQSSTCQCLQVSAFGPAAGPQRFAAGFQKATAIVNDLQRVSTIDNGP